MTSTFQIIVNGGGKNQFTANTKATLQPVNVAIPDYQQINNHICNMIVSYNDGSVKPLIARVLYNQLTEKWIVDGMAVVVNVINSSEEAAAINELTSITADHILTAHLNNQAHQITG